MANKKINQLVSKTAILSTDIFGIGDATTGQLFKKTIAELQAAIGGAVISVNGLVGTVVLDTDDVQELASPTNKYFTDARARGAISLTVTGNSGASTYSSGTGVLNVPTYTLAGLGGITASFLSGTSGISYNSTTGVITYSGTVYTDASIRALFSGSTGITYNSSTGAISYSGTVYTDSSVKALISMTTTGDSGASTYNNTTGVINVPNYTLAGLGGISLTSLSGGTGITYNSSTGAISYSGTVYTDASVRALISATGNISYNSTTGVISTSLTQYTDALARASVSLTTTGTSGASTYNSTTGVFNIPNYGSALSGYLPLTGGTLTGALGGTSATFSGSVTSNATTSVSFYSGTYISGTLGDGSFATYSARIRENTSYGLNIDLYDRTAATWRTPLSFNNTGGAATFSSSVTAGGVLSVFVSGNDTRLANFSTSTYSSTRGLRINSYQSSNGGQDCAIEFDSGVAGYGGFKFSNSGTPSLLITADGNIGVGTTTPAQKLDVSGNIMSSGSSTILMLNNTGGTAQSWWVGQDTAGTNDGIFYIYNMTSSTQAINIRKNNNVLIGTSTDNGEKLYVSGAIRATGTITANSDLTLKKNLLRIENALEKIEQINGYTYEFKEDDSKRHAGVIAQEIQTVLPEIVNKGNDGILGVEYGNISALLIEATKEQQKQIKAQQIQINELKALLNK